MARKLTELMVMVRLVSGLRCGQSQPNNGWTEGWAVMGSHGYNNGGKVPVRWMNSDTIGQADSHSWTGQVDR